MRETPVSRAWMKGRTGRSSNAWKGERAGYAAIHSWLARTFEKGDNCEGCGTTEAKRLEWANLSGEYKRARADYKVLCTPCHRRLDIGDKCRQGHPYTTENTYFNTRGHRICTICRAVKNKAYATNNQIQGVGGKQVRYWL